MQYTDTYADQIFSYANNIGTIEGGMHLQGFRQAVTTAINSYARKRGMLKESDNSLSTDDIVEGLTAVVSVKLQDPQFEGQTKTKLGNARVRSIVAGPGQRASRLLLRREPQVRARDRRQVHAGAARARRRQESARSVAPQERARGLGTARQARRLQERQSRRVRDSSWSRATRPAARPKADATPTRKPSCRCAARSSTSRRRVWTRCWPTKRSAR